MRMLLFVFFLFFFAQNVRAEESFYAYGASAETQEIVAVHFTEDSGKPSFEIVQRESLGMQGAPVLYSAEHRRIVVASLRAAEGEANKFVTFAVGDNGKLSDKKEYALPHGSAYLSFDKTGRFLLSASYFTGHVDVFPVGKNGDIGESVCNVFQDRDKAHSIRLTNDNQFAYVPYVKDQNAMFQYQFNAKTGQLKPLSPGQAKVGEDSGPRHVAHHPTKPFVYFSNEQQLGASVFRINDNGSLKLMQVCQVPDLKAQEGVAAADIEITADGKFAFVAVRDFANGKVDAIHSYAVLKDGTLLHCGVARADSIPWGLQVSPSGNFLLVTAAKGNTLTAFRIDPKGRLTAEASIEWGKMIRDIAVVTP